ncbi:hypothetical protein LCGC14_2832820, partial [marine sediment metagenome]
LAYGAIIATCRLVCVVTDAGAVRRIAGKDQVRWFFGPYGWVLADMKAVKPVPCRGFQGLWNIPDPIMAKMAA